MHPPSPNRPHLERAMPSLVLPFPDIGPNLIEIGPIAIRWYALAYIAGLIFAWKWVERMIRRPALWPANTPPMQPGQPEDLLTWMAVGVILGGRLGFVLFYKPDHYLAHPAEIVQIWHGGMSFHGGFLGVILGVLLWSRRKRLPLLSVGDAVACAAPMGLMFGRIANFINGELWGRPSDAPWAIIFPHPAAGGVPRHPSQLYEAALEGALLFLVMWFLSHRRGWLKRPGAMVGAFFIGYGAARCFVENFRQMDDFLNFVVPFGDTIEDGGITMGMLLSLPMIAIGLGFLWNARRIAGQSGPQDSSAKKA